jgi:hypothetical protein
MGMDDKGSKKENLRNKNLIGDSCQQVKMPPPDFSLDDYIKKRNEEHIKMNQKILSSFEPYDLEKIEEIINKADKEARKKNLDQQIMLFSDTLNEIRLIMDNSKKVYNLLEKEGENFDPDNFWIYFDQANNSKKKLEVQIQKLQHKKEYKADVLPELNIAESSKEKINVKTSIPEPQYFNENMTVKEVAAYINISTSYIYHFKDPINIPYYRLPTSGKNYYSKNLKLIIG